MSYPVHFCYLYYSLYFVGIGTGSEKNWKEYVIIRTSTKLAKIVIRKIHFIPKLEMKQSPNIKKKNEVMSRLTATVIYRLSNNRNKSRNNRSGGAPSSTPQTGGAPGSIASSSLVPPLNLKTLTDLFTNKSSVFTLQAPANNIMDSKVLTAMHNFFQNLNTSTFFAGFVMLILNIGSRIHTFVITHSQ